MPSSAILCHLLLPMDPSPLPLRPFPYFQTTPESLRQVSENTVARWHQQRAALAQPNLAVLRDMNPVMQLEPPQMLGPGPLGEAQYALRNTRGGGDPYPIGPTDVPGDDSPGKWLASRSVSGRLLAAGRTTKEEVFGSADRELRRRERERHQRRRQQSSPSGAHGEDGGRMEGKRQKEKKGKKKGRQERRCRSDRQGTGVHRPPKENCSLDNDESDNSSSSGSSRSSSTSSSRANSSNGTTSSGSSGVARRGKKGRHGEDRPQPQEPQPLPLPITPQSTINVAPALQPDTKTHNTVSTSIFAAGAESKPRHDNGSDTTDAASVVPNVIRSDPGDDFGLNLADRLLERMVGSERQLRIHGSDGSVKEPQQPGSKVIATAGGSVATKGGLGIENVAAEDEDGIEVVSPPVGRSRLLSTALELGITNPLGGQSPHARMVDVLHGPEVSQRAQKILENHSALRAQFLAAANNLRAEISSGMAAGQPGAAVAAGSTHDAGLSGGYAGANTSEPSSGLRGSPALAREPTLNQMAAPAAVPSTLSASGQLLGERPAETRAGDAGSAEAGGPGAVPASSTVPAQQPLPTDQQQSINIYCTQLVLNPGRGPITVPGLPAYFPAPGPAAWAGVPVAVPSLPTDHPGPECRDKNEGFGTSSASVLDPGQNGRAMYVRTSGQPSQQQLPPVVKVSPVATATWLPPAGARYTSLPAAAAGGITAATVGPIGRPIDNLGGGASEDEVFPVGLNTDGLHTEVPAASGGRTGPGKRLIRRVINNKDVSLDTSGGIMMLSREGRSGQRHSSPTASTSSVEAIEEMAEEVAEEVVESGESIMPQAPRTTPGVTLHGKPDGEVWSRTKSGSRSGSTHERQQSAVHVFRARPEGGAAAKDGKSILKLQKWEPPQQHDDQAGGSEVAASQLPGAQRTSSNGMKGGSPERGVQTDGPHTELWQVLPPQPLAQRQSALAAELTQLIMEAFQQSGGVISPAGTEGVAAAAAADASILPPKVSTTSAPDGARPVYLTDAFAATLNSTSSAAPTVKAAAPPGPTQLGLSSQASFLPSILPNAAVPRGKGPTFLQVRDINLEAQPEGAAGASVNAVEALTADILDGLGDWEAQAMAALQGHPPVGQPRGAGGRSDGVDRPRQLLGAGGGRGLTAAEVLVLEPDTMQQRKLAALRHLRARQEAAVAERRTRYQTGVQHFANPSRPLQPLFMAPPDYHGLPGGGDGIPVAGGDEELAASRGRGPNAVGSRRTLFPEARTHASLFPAQPAYLAGPGLERQPHARSPLQQCMHGGPKRRRRWSDRRNDPAISPQAAAMLQHQRNFLNQVRSTMRPVSLTSTRSPRRDGAPRLGSTGRVTSTVTFAAEAKPNRVRVSPEIDAVRSVAEMVAGRFEGSGWDRRGLESMCRMAPRSGGSVGRVELDHGADDVNDEDDDNGWNEDADPLGPETVCGGCNFPGCPVHGSRAAQAKESSTRIASAGADAVGSRAIDQTENEEMKQRTQREMHRAALLDRWTAEMQALNAATSRVEATQKVAVASAQQAVAARRERRAAQLADMFRLLGEVGELASTMEQQTNDTKKMMQVLEEEAELRRVAQLNSLLMEARRLGGLVDESLLQPTSEGEGEGNGPREAER
ncbi:hypothetical protein Vretimale_451 [Volvox reticuliferus]|uniref:Uncharacterized protein n=1 Tax=Volvox reticuliferus TaxID=1737510 RepID=A0A8J4D5R4_9CHLO|nr:hypothetical protein Vretimale_451 [Volvox reticuliferus]